MNRTDSLFAEDIRLSESLSYAEDDGCDDYFFVNESRESDKIHLFENNTEFDDDIADINIELQDEDMVDFLMEEL